jgi:hypothetical protein
MATATRVFQTTKPVIMSAKQGALKPEPVKNIVYISAGNTAEPEIIAGLLKICFKVPVQHIHWNKNAVRVGLQQKEPHCIVMSAPVTSQNDKEVYDVTQDMCPHSPLLWLCPNFTTIPEFTPSMNNIMVWVPGLKPVQNLVLCVQKLTGIEPASIL